MPDGAQIAGGATRPVAGRCSALPVPAEPALRSPRPQGSAGWTSLLVPWLTTPLAQSRQVDVLLRRSFVLALVLAVVTLLGGLADILVFPAKTAAELCIARVATSTLFVLTAYLARRGSDVQIARISIGLLILIPTIFFLVAELLLISIPHEGPAQLVFETYRLFPFALVAGISLFPMTAIAGVILASPVVGLEVVKAIDVAMNGGRVEAFSELWLISIIAMVAIISSVHQLHLLQSLVHSTAHDRLTGAFTRGVGEELLQMMYSQSRRNGSALSLVLLDLDNFKKVNDGAGHEAGDAVLRDYGKWLSGGLRAGDVIVRWGGDEFLLVLPDTGPRPAREAITRLWRQRQIVCGVGRTQTASIGLAERLSDRSESWEDLVRIADERSYVAKRKGKNRLVDAEGELLPASAAG